MCQVLGWPARVVLMSCGAAACGGGSPVGPEPEPGVLEVEVVTSGMELASAYNLLLEDGLWESVGAQAFLRFPVEPGTYRLELGGVPDNCAVAGENPRTLVVTRGDTARTAFAVTCSQTGSVQVFVTATGQDRALYEYDVTVSGHPGIVETGSSAVIDRVPGGVRAVRLSGLPHHCELQGEHPRAVTAVPGDTVPVDLAIACGPPPADRFVFAYVKDTDLPAARRIYVSGIEGLGRLRLTRDGAADRTPVWSPDGSRLAFVRYEAGAFRINVTASDGSDERVIATLSGEPGRPVWSPRGDQVAIPGYRDLYVAPLDGGEVINVTNDGEAYGTPTWSPDGTMLAYVRSGDIYRVFVGGGPAVRLTSHPRNEEHPIWSPDGTRIGLWRAAAVPCPYLPCAAEAIPEYVLITAEGTPVATFSVAMGIWSPDLTRFALIEGGWVRVTDLEGRTIVRNPVPISSGDPPFGGIAVTWSPSGTWLLASSAGGFAVIRANGAGSRILPGLEDVFSKYPRDFDLSPAWLPYP